jgi:two-component system, chemotaxis family, chemotaxis protein CheY
LAVNKNKRNLVIDGFATMRRIIKNLLRDLGFSNLDEADDGASALPLLKSGDFDFLIADWSMQIMEGIDLLKEIRSDPGCAWCRC